MTDDVHQEDHSSAIKTPQQLITVILMSFAVTITILVLLARFAATSSSLDKDSPAMSEEATAQRLKPVGEVALAESSAATGQRTAEDIVKTVCAACHESGALGAPKIGNQKDWAPRAARGLDKLTATAIKGVKAMPPKGGAAGLSDAEVTSAVIYMANKSGANFKETAPKAAPAMPAEKTAAAPAAAPAAGAKGKTVFDANCAACHATGVAGAPKLGDKQAWAPRLKGGAAQLYASALKGKAAMPPKGGNMGLADGDVKAAVDYMASQAK